MSHQVTEGALASDTLSGTPLVHSRPGFNATGLALEFK